MTIFNEHGLKDPDVTMFVEYTAQPGDCLTVGDAEATGDGLYVYLEEER